MPTTWPNPFLILRTVLFGFFLAVTITAHAADGGFSSTLSTEQKNSSGLANLTPEESAALDRLVAIEIAQARKENSIELEGTFVTRRTDEDRKQAGLDRLTPAQLTKLNGLIAAAVAAGPKPKERPRIKDSEVFTAQRKPEVHGEFSLTYGRTSGGGEMRGASMWVDYFDPNTGLSLGVGVSHFTGKGLRGFYPGYYGSSPFYGSGIGFYGSPYDSFGSDYFPESEGPPYLGLSDDVNSPDYRGFRRR